MLQRSPAVVVAVALFVCVTAMLAMTAYARESQTGAIEEVKQRPKERLSR